MAMDTDAVRVQLVDTLVTDFVAAHPLAKINFENQRLEQDESNGWIYVSIMPGDMVRKEIGSRATSGQSAQYSQFGIVQVQMAIKKDGGTKTLHAFADTIINSLVDRDWSISGGRLMTLNADRRVRGVIAGSYAMNVIIEWEYRTSLS
jgi:hypothetical protein